MRWYARWNGFKFYLEQHGWIVARKEQLVERLMRF
ncbi:ASH protein [Escherichia coli O25b:H4]|uniref:ASH protein n=1 Tax=Escherichia coli O25b:H4 TaxID=941280 RepID=A0A192CM35_ECO25|nr:ASH protein [Escherichia coli O25b:H4]